DRSPVLIVHTRVSKTVPVGLMAISFSALCTQITRRSHVSPGSIAQSCHRGVDENTTTSLVPSLLSRPCPAVGLPRSSATSSAGLIKYTYGNLNSGRVPATHASHGDVRLRRFHQLPPGRRQRRRTLAPGPSPELSPAVGAAPRPGADLGLS